MIFIKIKPPELKKVAVYKAFLYLTFILGQGAFTYAHAATKTSTAYPSTPIKYLGSGSCRHGFSVNGVRGIPDGVVTVFRKNPEGMKRSNPFWFVLSSIHGGIPESQANQAEVNRAHEYKNAGVPFTTPTDIQIPRELNREFYRKPNETVFGMHYPPEDKFVANVHPFLLFGKRFGRLGIRGQLLPHKEVINHQTLADIQAAKKALQAKDLLILDLQGGITAEGRFKISDPLVMTRKKPGKLAMAAGVLIHPIALFRSPESRKEILAKKMFDSLDAIETEVGRVLSQRSFRNGSVEKFFPNEENASSAISLLSGNTKNNSHLSGSTQDWLHSNEDLHPMLFPQRENFSSYPTTPKISSVQMILGNNFYHKF